MTLESTAPLSAGGKIGAYVLIQRLGNPGMGDVWLARHEQNSQSLVAVKCVISHLRADPQMVARFWRECAVQQRLHHPHIVPVRECIPQGNDLFLVMPYIDGGSLEDLLRHERQLPVAKAVKIATQVLEALNYAHQQGVIHRDVKPSNILLGNGAAYLSDFGIVQLMGSARGLTTDSSGTIAYMSPEQIQRPGEVDQRSDVYGLGCVLYEMLTGRQPFLGHTDDDVKYQHVTRPPEPPRTLNPAIGERLERVVLTSLAKSPADRFPGCGSFARALEVAVAPSMTPETVSFARNLGVVAAGWGAGVLMLLAGLSLHGARYQDAIFLALLTCGPITGITYLRLLYLAWKSIQDSLTPVGPGQVILLLMIPLVNLYALVPAYLHLPRHYNLYAERHGLAPRLQVWPFFLYCATVWISLLLLYTTHTPGPITVVTVLQQILVVPLLVWQLARAINRMAAAKSGTV